jgi:hypothetical protein
MFSLQWSMLEYKKKGRSVMRNMFHHDTETNDQVPQPIRDDVGATDPGPRNVPLDLQNPDVLKPPSTD